MKMEEYLSTMTEEQIYKKTPQEITTLLHQTCLERLEKAIVSIHNREYMEANSLLQNCNDILYRLGAGINYEAGIIADQLEALYDYMARNIIEANWKKDIGALEETRSLLSSIQEAWTKAFEKGTDNKGCIIKKRILSYEQDYNTPFESVDVKE